MTLTGVAGRAGLSAADPVVSGTAGNVTPGTSVAPLTSTRACHGVTRAMLTLTRALTAWAPPPSLTHRVTPHSWNREMSLTQFERSDFFCFLLTRHVVRVKSPLMMAWCLVTIMQQPRKWVTGSLVTMTTLQITKRMVNLSILIHDIAQTNNNLLQLNCYIMKPINFFNCLSDIAV